MAGDVHTAAGGMRGRLSWGTVPGWRALAELVPDGCLPGSHAARPEPAPFPSLMEANHMHDEQALYGLVRFDGATNRQVVGIVLVFESATAANQFARTAGLDDYAVGPVEFLATTAPAGIRWNGADR
ncbi:hypothetical protein [Frankia sp. Cr1]|uniref:hypothetical protein n=1 Tax=Frankia sp. Cr1 TaxID=3073931 RepID=UPI002AD5699D|nr:hypothetical protein [Frankia sp. Cr1]